MKCNNCSSTWEQSPNAQKELKECPFCGEKLVDEATTYFESGERKKSAGQYDEAIADFTEAISRSTGAIAVASYLGRGLALHELKRHEEALSDFDRVIAIAPDQELLYGYRAKVYVDLMNNYWSGRNGYAKDLFKTFEYAMKAAEAGIASAQQHVGYSYSTGLGVKADTEQALLWFHKAANQNHAESLNSLGVFYSEGRGKAPLDWDKGFSYYKRAADLGHHHAEYQTGISYLRGRGTQPDKEKASEYLSRAIKYWLDKVAKGENLSGWDWQRLGAAYESGVGIEQNYVKARECYEKSAAQNHVYGQCSLGEYYELGKGGLTVDYAEALKYYTLSSQQGNLRAYYRLGDLYYFGRGVAEDKGRAAEYYQNAADRGDFDATQKLAIMYRDGDGISQDIQKALALYEIGVKEGRPEYLYDMALWYLKGKGVSQDVPKALDYLEKAVSKEHIQSLVALGELYNDGLYGITTDYEKAFGYYDRATKLGNTGVLNKLGLMYYFGRGGVDTNYSTAIEYWIRCGTSVSLYNAGNTYEIGGHGIAQDFKKAFEYFDKAAKLGYTEALNKLGLMYYYGRGGVEASYSTAVDYWVRCNSPASLFNAGYVYENGGYGITQDLSKAASFYEKSANAGYAAGLRSLARFYYEGIYYEKDVDQAARLYRKAAEAGDEQAKNWLQTHDARTIRENETAAAVQWVVERSGIVEKKVAYYDKDGNYHRITQWAWETPCEG